MASNRAYPVIVITGTPGTGKSIHANLLEEESPVPLKHINVGELVKQRNLHDGFDEAWQSYVVDEDKLVDELEPIVAKGGVILDWHTCDVYPERWVDLVVVLRCNHTLLWERLEKRGYPLKKVQENNEVEIMGIISDEAREAYAADIIVELQSESERDLEENIGRMVTWINNWCQNNSMGQE